MGKSLNSREEEKAGLKQQFQFKSVLGAPVSISDLREKEFNGEKLSKKEKLALVSFDKYRISVLNRQENEDAFHKKYMELQALSNLAPFEEFLKEEYMVD